MNSNANNTSTNTLRPRPWTGISDDLRERRRDRAARVALRRKLATYNTQAQVDDLLGALPDQDDAAAEEFRSILTSNLARRPQSGHLAG